MRYYRYQAAILSVPGCDTIGTRLLYFSGTINQLFEKAASPFQSQHHKRNVATRVHDVQASRFAGFRIKEL